MPDLTARIAEILREHQWRGDILGCGCGWNWPHDRTHFCGEDERISVAHAEHVAALIAAAAQDHYRPRVETDAELQSLPHGSIVLGAGGGAWEHEIDEGLHYWYRTGESDANAGDPQMNLPAVVLWSPGAGE